MQTLFKAIILHVSDGINFSDDINYKSVIRAQRLTVKQHMIIKQLNKHSLSLLQLNELYKLCIFFLNSIYVCILCTTACMINKQIKNEILYKCIH